MRTPRRERESNARNLVLPRSVVIIGTRGYPSYYGGFETAVRKLAPYLADRGWDVTVYCRAGNVTGGRESADARVIRRVTWGIDRKSVSTMTYGLSSVIDASRRRPDAALIMNVANGYWLPLLRARGIRTLVNVDGMEWDRAKWGRFAKRVFRTGARLTARFADRLIFDSERIAERWGIEFGRDGAYIPYGAEMSPMLPIEEGLSHRGYVLFVARLVPENTIDEFLRAAAVLSKRWPVVIVGSSGYGGEIEAEVRQLAKSTSNVRWLGQLSDDGRLFSLWQHAGVYFHGHSVGGTNPSLVQAMAAGAPIVARDTEFNREVLDESGLFVRPSSSEIVCAIERLFRDQTFRETLSARAVKRASDCYTWESVCGDYEKELTVLVDREHSTIPKRFASTSHEYGNDGPVGSSTGTSG